MFYDVLGFSEAVQGVLMCSVRFQKSHEECEAFFNVMGVFGRYLRRSHGFEEILKGFTMFSGILLIF